MNFLVDAQLPPALSRMLKDRGHRSEHVLEIGMETAQDEAVWSRGESTGAAILTKDEDFAVMSGLRPAGPAVVWIRVGNTTRRGLLEWFEPRLPAILEALERGERLIELV